MNYTDEMIKAVLIERKKAQKKHEKDMAIMFIFGIVTMCVMMWALA